MEKEAARPRFGVMQIVIMAIVAALVTVTAILSAFVTFVPGISFFYIPLGLEPCFGAWFGIWGVLGAYLGGFAYQPYYGIPILYGAVIGTTDAWGALMALILFKGLKADPALRTGRDWLVAIVTFAVTVPTQGFIYNLQLVPLGWYTLEYVLGEGMIKDIFQIT